MNKLSRATLRDLTSQVRALAGEALDLLAIQSSSPTLFAAGADMRELLDLNPVSALAYAALGQDLMQALESFPAPVLALVSGPCLGGAFDLVLACHAVWATSATYFCHPGAHLGMMTGFGGTVRLPEKLPGARARFMLLSGYRMPAAEALELGLVARLFDSHEDMQAALLGERPSARP